jgi:hypothetical protein
MPAKKPTTPDPETEATPRTNPFLTKTIGREDTKSRDKAEKAADRADQEIKRVQAEPLGQNVQAPLGSNGTPMIQVEMSAAELIPTGNYANVSIGPARMHFWVDPDKKLEADVVAVQRNIVLESMQQQGGDQA